MRVAHLVATAGATGVESYLLTLLGAFDPARVEATLFVPGEGPLVERARAKGIRVELGAPSRKLDFGAARRLAERWRGRFDVIHAHGPRALFWAGRAARAAAIPQLVATVHELRWQTLPPSWKREVWIALERLAMSRADDLITVSDATRRDLLARWPEFAARTRVVHASTPHMSDRGAIPLASPRREVNETFRVATVGRFDWQKGYDLLLPAMAEWKRRGVDFELDIVGHGTLEPGLRALSARLGLEGRIRWHPAETSVPELLSLAHVYVTASRAEMFGIAVLEAMCAGLPVVASAAGSLVEVVEDGVTGVLVPLRPEASFAARIVDPLERLRMDPVGAAEMGERGLERAWTLFSPERLAAGVSAVYRRGPVSSG
ncbi:MAG: glycosyltransferase family 4 protein [Candidatus Eisenbacteria bacterium]|uniref:Glycosyltransferase family 4 protein n=1 Tax=Eiseniibacteriota bacterium TaxID=2212470 RepID=A0A849SZL5_UNCEI|nr:glycosyltransferase family 4 protein [Candidatus Eisenbacteria bacterium]